MDIPGGRAALSALSSLYNDTAVIRRSRADAAANSMVTETVYDGVRCHLSSRKGLGARRTASLNQTAAQAQAAVGYTVFFAPGVAVNPGDFITVTHAGQTVSGRAGFADYGALGVSVALDSTVVA